MYASATRRLCCTFKIIIIDIIKSSKCTSDVAYVKIGLNIINNLYVDSAVHYIKKNMNNERTRRLGCTSVHAPGLCMCTRATRAPNLYAQARATRTPNLYAQVRATCTRTPIRTRKSNTHT